MNLSDFNVKNAKETAIECLNGLSRTRADDYHSWVQVGMAIKNSGLRCSDWDTWSRISDKYEPGLCEKKWNSFNGDGKCVTVASLVHWYEQDTGQKFNHKKNCKKPIATKAKTNSPESKRVLRRRSFADISPQETAYLIPEVVAKGKMTSLVSQEGEGKSSLAGGLSAKVSIGGHWPTGGQVEAGDVVIFSHEESPECSIAPRLIANGADVSRVHLAETIIEVDGEESEFDIERDIQVLDDWADQLPELRLVIFDPITSYVDCNENSNSEVRRALKPLIDFAERRNVAVLALTHLSKKVDLGMINRTLGSRAWSSVPRMIWGIQAEQTEDEDGHKVDTGSRFLLCIKSNLGRKPKGLKFSIGDDGQIVFDSERYNLNIDQQQPGGIEPSRATEIGDWLRERIGVDVIPASEITAEGCRKWNISIQRLGKIATDSGICKRKSAADGCWVWTVRR